VGVAARRRRDAVAAGEPLRLLVEPREREPRVEDLEDVDVGDVGAQQGGAGHRVETVERMGHIDDAALLLDGRDGVGERHPRRDGALEEEADHLALRGFHLLADDDAHAIAVAELTRLETAGDGVVIGDGDDVETDLARALQDVLHGRDAVLAVVRMHVEVAEDLALPAAAAPCGAPPPRDLVVELLVLIDDPSPVEARGRAHARSREPLARLRLAHHRAQGGGQRRGVADRDEQPLVTVADRLPMSRDVARDDRRPRRHRFKEDEAGGLRTERGCAEDVGIPQNLLHGVARQAAVEGHALGERAGDAVAEPALLSVVAADVKFELLGHIVETAERAKQQAQSLTSRLAGGEHHANRSGTTRRARPQRADVHAGRDDPVGAGELARSGVTDRRATGDGDVQRVEQALLARARHQVLDEPLVLAEERGHERTGGVPQGRPAHRRRERLVEVQDIEVVGLEEDVDVGDEVGRGGEHGTRPSGVDVRAAGEEVARRGLVGQEHGLALPQQHRLHPRPRLAYRGPVGTGGDDGHAVATVSQTLRESRDLVVHLARRRPRVRGEKSDAVTHRAMLPQERRLQPT